MWAQPTASEPTFWSAGRHENQLPDGGVVSIDLAADEDGPRAIVGVIGADGTEQLGEFNIDQFLALKQLFEAATADIMTAPTIRKCA